VAFKGINIYETKDYISPNDPDKDSPTVFKLGAIDTIMDAQIKDVTATYDRMANEYQIKSGRRIILTVKMGLKGMENFLDPRTNQPVKFDTVSMSFGGKNYQVVTDEILKMFTPELMFELSNEITRNLEFSEEERKN